MHRKPLTRRELLTGAVVLPFALRDSLLLSQSPQSSTSTVVKTPDGALRGETTSGISVFRGISFAEPPVGPLRFRPPVPAKPWSGTHDALRFASPAIQPPPPGPQSASQPPANPPSEDCLYLNVWVPEDKGPFPVYVWIHGGGFTNGNSFDPVFDGTSFARDGIVCVTIAYRLGVFGFLDVSPLLGPDYAGSANNAVRDVIAALTWVRRNISAFGGDPERVTVGGESAGAKMTGILMGVPSARPLFHQMISESGGAERVWPTATALEVGSGFAELWHDRSDTSPANLATAPAAAILAAQQAFLEQWPQHFPLRPAIESNFLPQLPVMSVSAGSTRGKRLLIGTNRDESAVFIGPHPAHDPTAADLANLPLATFNQVFPRYTQLYPDLTDEQRRIRAVTAEEYWVPSLRLADAHVQGGGAAWLYEFTFSETTGRFKGYAYHTLELPLAWNHPHPPPADAAAEQALAATLHAAWVAFLKGATPAAPDLPSWPAYQPKTRPTMILDTKSTTMDAPQHAELSLWSGLMPH